jgi:phosphatidylserine/phosphatidylglycerophosphate/cardiolipin synthase-like enzyme
MPVKNAALPVKSAPPPVKNVQNVIPQALLAEDKLVPLVDGPEIFGAMGKALAQAKEYIYLTAWLIHLNVKLGPLSLRQHLLAKAKQGVKVRIILCDLDIVMGKAEVGWEDLEIKLAEKLQKQDPSGNIRVLVSPMKSLALKGKTLQELATKFGKRPILLGSHHQKTLVIDGNVGFCSGCDITADVSNPSKWHDASIMIQGAGVHGLEQNFVERWNTEGKGTVPALSIGGNARKSDVCDIIRTMPSWWFNAAQIKDHYLSIIGDAKKTIYLENQYLRHPEIGAALEEAAQRGVKITIVLPRLPEEAPTGDKKIDLATRMGIYAQYKVLKPLSKQANIKILSPTKRQPYIHSKLLVADEEVTLLGSANLNGRSLNAKADSEINALVKDPKFAVELLTKLRRSAKKWNLVPHKVESDEVISRITDNEPDLKPLYTARTLHNAASALSPQLQAGSWVLTNLAGFGGILNFKSPEGLRDSVLDALVDYL